MKNIFAGKNILIFGLGLLGGGVGSGKFFIEQKANVTVTDKKTKKELSPSIAKLRGSRIKFIIGKHREKDILNSDLIIRNPDVPYDSPYLKLARSNKIPVETDVSLFLRLYPYKKNVIGVTGTRGKTTTTFMVSAILNMAGFKTNVGGNIKDISTLSLLKKAKKNEKIVLELSSWQLQNLGEDKISPHIAVITNIYEDHLNRYESLEEYISDKKNIFKYQNLTDFLVLNAENEITKTFAKTANSKVVFFDQKTLPRSFRLKTPGSHNRENAAAAITVARILGISDEFSKIALEKFPGVEFRLEKIRTLKGVKYINDTTSTTPIAGSKALDAFDRPVILIAGGNTKNLNMDIFAKKIAERAKKVILLKGSGTQELKTLIDREAKRSKKKSPIFGEIFDNFNNAITTAQSISVKGDIVLLSPGLTSFGMFKNEFDRGEQFNRIVRGLR